jgi:hypothetical protein
VTGAGPTRGVRATLTAVVEDASDEFAGGDVSVANAFPSLYVKITFLISVATFLD